MKTGQDEFFAVVGEGAALLKNLDEQSSGFFDDINRLREILAILGFGSAVKPLKISQEDKDGAAKALSDYLNNGIKVLPDAIKVFEALSVRSMAQSVGDVSAADEAYNIANIGAGNVREDSTKRAVFDHFAARGVKHGIEPHVLEASFAEAKALMSDRVDQLPEYVAARAECDRLSEERSALMKALRVQINEGYISGTDVSALVDKEAELWNNGTAEYNAAWDKVRAISKKFEAERVDAIAKVLDAKGEAIIAKIAEASPITPEQATAWAKNQIIDEGARKKLKKEGYDPEQVVRDMAEYYRLTGGKASTIRLSLDGRGRANAVGIFTRGGEKIINLGSGFDKTTLFHELSHHLENDPVANAAANGFLIKRRESEKLYTLKSLTGNKGYRSDEKAWKDHFMSEYIGKYYSDGATEVFSMGVQYLAKPREAARLAAKDPELFAMITGYLSNPLTPAQAAKLNMHSDLINGAVQKIDDEVELYERAIKFLAAKAPLEKDDWFESLDKESKFYYNLTSYTLDAKAEYLGSNGSFKVFATKVRNPNTKRYCKGFVTVNSNLDAERESGFMANIPKAVSALTLPQAQAVIALANRDGTSLRDAQSYFRERKKLIDTVGVENLQ